MASGSHLTNKPASTIQLLLLKPCILAGKDRFSRGSCCGATVFDQAQPSMPILALKAELTGCAGPVNFQWLTVPVCRYRDWA